MLFRQQGRGHQDGRLPPAMKAARMATSVLPKPTSPQTTRSMGLGPVRSRMTASIVCNWSAVSSNGKAAAN
jgi:hypothetical protein